MKIALGKRAFALCLVFLAIGIAIGYEIHGLTFQPNIILIDVTKYNAKGAGATSPGLICVGLQTVGVDFWLTNSGMSNGIASVRLNGGGRTLADNSYLVGAGQSIHRSIKVDVDCRENFEVGISIVEVTTP